MAAPSSHIRVGGTWKKINNQYVRVAGVWKPINNSYVRTSGVWKKVFSRRITVNLTIASSTTNYNAYTAAGSPADGIPRDVILIINSGVAVYSTSTATPGLSIGGSWPTGSTFTIINNHYIIGMGGAGGTGGAYSNGYGGAAGGPALTLHSSIPSVTINNTAGYILGGGGGGGGGGSFGYFTAYSEWVGGGGGGGGCSWQASAGGAAQGAYMPVTYAYLTNSPGNGANGTSAGGGAGGSYGRSYTESGAEPPISIWEAFAGVGGAGGLWGVAGSTGQSSYVGPLHNRPPPYTAPGGYATGWYVGGAGGAGGKAINLNGSSIVWTGGNNSSQVQGAVS